MMPHLKCIDWRCDNVAGEDSNSPRMRFKVALPHLETLVTLRSKTSHWLTGVVSKWDLPSLSNIVVGRLALEAQSGLSTIWDSFGDTLRIVELGISPKGCSAIDNITDVLSKCPNLTELCMGILYLLSQSINVGHLSSSLTTIRLSRGQYHETREKGKSSKNTFRVLDPPYSLQKIVLHGNWTFITNDDRFSKFQRLLRDGLGVTSVLRTLEEY